MAEGKRLISDEHRPSINQLYRESEAIQVLKRHLSTRTTISTSSSLAERYQRAAENDELRTFRQIGAGACKTVFEWTGTEQAIGLSKQQGATPAEGLWNDFKMHSKILEAFETAKKKEWHDDDPAHPRSIWVHQPY